MKKFKNNIQRFNYLKEQLKKHGLGLGGPKTYVYDTQLNVGITSIIMNIDITALPINGYDVLEEIPELRTYIENGREQRIQQFNAEQNAAHAFNQQSLKAS